MTLFFKLKVQVWYTTPTYGSQEVLLRGLCPDASHLAVVHAIVPGPSNPTELHSCIIVDLRNTINIGHHARSRLMVILSIVEIPS